MINPKDVYLPRNITNNVCEISKTIELANKKQNNFNI